MKPGFLSSLLRFFFPKRCCLCHEYLVEGEEMMCLTCQMKLPRVHAFGSGNESEKRLWGRVDFVHGSSFIAYNKKSQFSALLRTAKYGQKPWYNFYLAKMFAVELRVMSADGENAGWPYDIDVIVPVPIHWRRRLMRGYNQSEQVARGLSEVWHLPVEFNCLYKCHYTPSQVGKSVEERLSAEVGSFDIRHPERLKGLHVLLVDDIMTSGGTIEACAKALGKVPGLRLSYLTLGLTS